MTKLSSEIQKVFVQWGRSGGKLRAKRLSSSQRSLIASRAARARWRGQAAAVVSAPSSVRLQQADWDSPVYVEEVLSDGGILAWRALYRRIFDFPFGGTAEALARVLASSEMVGVTPLWKGLLGSVRGGAW